MRPVLPVFVPWLVASALCACGSAPPRTGEALATTPLLRISDGDGDQPQYAYRLGRAYEGQGDLARASAAYARSLALDPDQLDARNAQAVLLAKQGRLTEAADLLRRLAADFPAQAQPLGNLGYVQHLQGQDAQAVATLRAALALEPDYGPARANLALLGGARDPSAALAATPRPLPTTATPHLQLVQLAPNEFRLQAPVAVNLAAAVAALSATTSASTFPHADTLAGATTAVEPVTECLQIVNGTGAPGSAARIRDVLRHRGFAAASSALSNQRGYTQAHTVIEYVPGQKSRARALRAALRGPATLAPVTSLPRQVSLRLVLGQDQPAITPNLLARQERPATAFNQESP